jgi:ComF family protein
LCAVPLHPKRLAERGYNQSELVASELAARWEIPLLGRMALQRVRETCSQVDLGRAERLTNVRNAFAADPALVRGLQIVLFDDVCTTGATLVACAEALLAAGARRVSAVTLARAP